MVGCSAPWQAADNSPVGTNQTHLKMKAFQELGSKEFISWIKDIIFMQIRLKVVRNCICIPFAECYKIALIVVTALLLLQRMKSDFEKQMHNAK